MTASRATLPAGAVSLASSTREPAAELDAVRAPDEAPPPNAAIPSLSPAFSRDVLTYNMSLPFETTGLTLTPTASTGIASVLLNGVSFNSGDTSSPLLINLGSNVFTIVVTALDGIVQQTYTIHITRSPPIAGDLDLRFNGTGKATLGIGPEADYV